MEITINRDVLIPFVAEIRRLEREYGFDRPDHQYQCLMIPLSDLKALLEEISKCS